MELEPDCVVDSGLVAAFEVWGFVVGREFEIVGIRRADGISVISIERKYSFSVFEMNKMAWFL